MIKYAVKPLNTESAILSCYTGQILYIVKRLMPKNFFKDEYIAISDTHATMRKNKVQGSGSHELRVPKFPMLYVEPNFAIAESYMEHLERNLRGVFSNVGITSGLHVMPIFFDDIHDLNLSAVALRRRYTFNVRLIVKSENEALNVLGWVRQSIPINRPQRLMNRPSEYVIPNEIVHKIAQLRGWSEPTENNAITIRAYLDSMSPGSINDIVIGASGNRNLTYLHNQDYLFAVESIDIANVNSRKNQSKDPRISIDLAIWLESLIPARYILSVADFSNFINVDPGDIPESATVTGAIVRQSVTKETPPMIRNGTLSMINDNSIYVEYNGSDTLELKTLWGTDFFNLFNAYRLEKPDEFQQMVVISIYSDRYGELPDDEWEIVWDDEPHVYLPNPKPYMMYRVIIWVSFPEFTAFAMTKADPNYKPEVNRSYTGTNIKTKYVRHVELQPLPDGIATTFALSETYLPEWFIKIVIAPTSTSIHENRRSIVFAEPPDASADSMYLEAILEQ
jgi:hypothetical protein